MNEEEEKNSEESIPTLNSKLGSPQTKIKTTPLVALRFHTEGIHFMVISAAGLRMNILSLLLFNN